jgi:hypothetical protein
MVTISNEEYSKLIYERDMRQIAISESSRVPESEAATDAFGALIDAHLIRPEHFAALCYRYHAYLVDHQPAIQLQLEPRQELEAVGDAIITAIQAAEIDEQDNYEGVEK